MASTRSTVRFLHLADLHLMNCRHGGGCGRNQAACHVCIKERILDGLCQRITRAETRPDLILLAGDLTERRECRGDLRAATAPLDRLVRKARERGIAVAGIAGDHDGDDATRGMRRELGWDWLLESGEVNRETPVAVYGVEGRPNRIGAAEELSRLRRVPGEPSVVLLHGDPKLARSHQGPRFDYYAMGHLHRARIRSVARGSHELVGYPGHLYSYWDGDGKSWPVYVIEGSVDASGRVTAQLVSLSKELGMPETRRLFVDFADLGSPSGTIVFENAPEAAFFDRVLLPAELEEQIADGAPYRRLARIPYDSRAELKRHLHKVLDALPDDVFVSPSTGQGWTDRVADYGDRIRSRRFDEFVTKTFKPTPNTQ